jgi:uncharacterized membrane protein YjgN (DUF898 family)
MSGSRARILGLLGVLIGFLADYWLTGALAESVPSIVPLVFEWLGRSPVDAATAAEAFFEAYGAHVARGVGLLGTLTGGAVAGLIAPRNRIEFAFGEGIVAAAAGLPDLVLMLQTTGPSWYVVAAVWELALFVLVAALGGGVAVLLVRVVSRRGAPEAAVHAPPPEGLATAGPPAAAPVATGTFRAGFHGDGADLFRIHIVNMLLTFVTLGTYRFWARVKVRRYLYSHTEFEGDRFAFHGTGAEAFRGWLKGAAFVGLPIIAIRFVEQFVSVGSQFLLEVLVMLAVSVVVPIGICGAWRYRLSRTEWRGLRFSFRGRPGEAVRTWLASLLLTVLSLGVCFPLLQTNLHRFLARHAYYGTRRFGFDGRGGDLVRGFLLRFLLPAVPTAALTVLLARDTSGLSVLAGGLFLVRLWCGYSAYKTRYLMAHTSFEAARFRSSITGLGLFGLNLLNLCLVWGTFGLGIPWAQVRTQRYALANLVLEGPLDLAGVLQDARDASVTGEGIADVLDADAIDLGIGV